MRDNASKAALETAEDVLHKIYGPDFQGCKVTLDSIAEIIQATLDGHTQDSSAMLSALREVLEAVELLSTPPSKSEIKDGTHLARLLGERADGIRAIAAKALEAIKLAQAHQSE